MLIRDLLSFLVVLNVLALPRVADGFQTWLASVKPYVPVVPCDALGHQGCAGGRARHPFGEDFAANDYTYDQALCAKDSDGDGLSNGDEFGDPCCTLKNTLTGLTRTDKSLTSHPGVSNEKANVRSCAIVDPVGTSAEAFVKPTFGSKKVELALSYPAAAADCFCTYRLEVKVTKAKDKTSCTDTWNSAADWLNPNVVLQACSALESGDTVTVTPTYFNLKNTAGVAGAAKTFTIATTDTAVDNASTTTATSIGSVQVTAAAVAVNGDFFSPIGVFVALVFGTGLLALVLRLTTSPVGALSFLYKPLFVPSKKRYSLLLPFASMQVGGALFLLVALAAVSTGLALWADRKTSEGDSDWLQIIALSVSHLGALSMIVVMLLTPRILSPARLVFGSSFECVLSSYHRLFGAICTWSVWLHGILQLTRFSKAAGILTTIQGDEMVAGTGLAAFCCISLGYLFAAPPIVHNFYAVFRTMHNFMPVACVLGTWHCLAMHERSKGTMAEGIVMALALGLITIDQAYDWFLAYRHRTILDPNFKPRVVNGHVHLRLSMKNFQGPLGGKFASLTVPSLSFVSHPFSMFPSPADQQGVRAFQTEKQGGVNPNVDSSGKFDLLIKVNEPNKWTGRLSNSILQAEQNSRPWRPRVVVSGPYGEGLGRLAHCDAVILVAGGSGITAVASVAAALPASKVLGVFWAFRAPALAGVVSHCFAHLEENKTEFWLTDLKLPAGAEQQTGCLQKVQRGKPSVQQWIRDRVEPFDRKTVVGSGSPRNIGIFGCGPDALMHDIWSFAANNGRVAQSRKVQDGLGQTVASADFSEFPLNHVQLHLAIETFRFV